MQQVELIKPFEETIYRDGIENVGIDFAEMALDDLTKLLFKEVSDTVLDWPVLSWATAIGKTGWSIGKAFSLKKQLAFIQSLRDGTIDQEAIEKRRKAIEKQEAWIEKEIETSLIYLERYANVKKSIYQARMYRDLLNGAIVFDEYEEYLAILDQLLIGDAAYLLDIVSLYAERQKEFYDPEKTDELTKYFNNVRCGRLQSMGLLKGIITSRLGSSTIDKYIPTDQGFYMYSLIREENDTTHPKIFLRNAGA